MPTGLWYQFAYPDDAPPANGWGELDQVTLPSGAKINYHYRQKTVIKTLDTLAENPLVSKQVTWTDEQQEGSTIVGEPWAITWTGTLTEVTGPDGGKTTYVFGPQTFGYGGHNLLYKVIQANGDITERRWVKNHLVQRAGLLSRLLKSEGS